MGAASWPSCAPAAKLALVLTQARGLFGLPILEKSDELRQRDDRHDWDAEVLLHLPRTVALALSRRNLEPYRPGGYYMGVAGACSIAETSVSAPRSCLSRATTMPAR